MPNDTDATTPGRQLRYGVMYNGGPLSAWQDRCIRELSASGTATLVLGIANATVGERNTVRGLRDIRWKTLLFDTYTNVFGGCSATEACEGRLLFADVPTINCTVERKGKYSEYFTDADLNTIAAYDLDFILRFGFGIIRGRVHDVPRYGVWSFHHDDERKIRGTPASFWPIYNGDPQSGLILQRLNDKLDGGIVLRRGSVPTIETSYIRNREQAFLTGIPFPTDLCRDILAGNTREVCGAPSPTDAPIYMRPTNLQMIRFIGKLLGNRLRRCRSSGQASEETRSSGHV